MKLSEQKKNVIINYQLIDIWQRLYQFFLKQLMKNRLVNEEEDLIMYVGV